MGIRNREANLNLTEEQQRIYELGKIAQQNHLTPEKLQKLIEQDQKKHTPPASRLLAQPEEGVEQTINKIRERIKKEPQMAQQEEEDPAALEPEQGIKDEDEFARPSVDLQKKIAKKEEQLKEEIEALTRIEALTEAANGAARYSFLWFKSLLELEYLNSHEINTQGKSICLEFASVERERGADRIWVLKHPNRYLPSSIEDIGDLSVRLFTDQGSHFVGIEVVSVKEYTLRVKLKAAADQVSLDPASVKRAVIDIKNPVFVLEELRRQFYNFSFSDEYDLKENLTENIHFVFGPPGTGKTTHLAKDIIIPLMEGEEELKILVLTPTNKAADVLTERIISEMGPGEGYKKWLVRFGTTGNPAFETEGIYKDRTFDIQGQKRNVTVTTIARFPYDFFAPVDGAYRLYLKDQPWDYIIVDEASMIPLVNMVFLLYYSPEVNFIIAGDPFQIEPITTIKNWKGANIYELVELNRFAAPQTTPHDYPITNLTTQYRSIPSIGMLFSQFSYSGLLQHSRSATEQKPLIVEGLDIKDINLIKFPVNTFHSIYRANRLDKTPYQVYSALLTFELVKYVMEQIKKHHPEPYTLGIICPYRAQATLVEKLFSTAPVKRGPVDLHIGTIHSFQGDQCDIVFALLNPPPYISESPDMFLNKQNILNVCMSRARDYLFLLLPDEKTDNIDALTKLAEVEALVKKHAPHNYTRTHAQHIEKVIFKEANFIADNSFATTHQPINVYGEADKRYEVRCEESAIDIQITQTEAPHDNTILAQRGTVPAEKQPNHHDVDMPINPADTFG